MTYRIGIIGTGDPDGEGFAMAYRHAEGYRRLDSCELVACADLVPENAETFARTYDVADDHVYESHERMVTAADLDVVSVCVPPVAHADIVVDAATHGSLRGIHCEKPMALEWADAQRMAEACADADVQLTINHQLRFGAPYRKARGLLDAGRVGELRRVEFRRENLYDNGTHAFDAANFYANQSPVEWVIGQVDYTEENSLFGAHHENQALVQWRYENGVYGLASTGDGEPFVDALFRLVGTEGVIEIGTDGELSYRRDGAGWTTVDTGVDSRYGPEPGILRRGVEAAAQRVSTRLAERVSPPSYTARAIEEAVSSLRRGERSELSAQNALAADKLIFAAWESSRRRGRVDLPLDIEDNPLESMVESGALDPAPSDDDDGETRSTDD